MPNINFNNIETAFAHKSTSELKKAYSMFSIFNIGWLNNLMSSLGNIAFKLKLPISWMVRNNIFNHFCGGEDIYDCESTVELLKKHNVESNLDYSIEATHGNKAFDNTRDEIVANIELCSKHAALTFTSLKVTGLIDFDILQKVSNNENLSESEQIDLEIGSQRLNKICQTAHQHKIRVFVDAEESWIQQAIDNLTDEMMALYNKEEVIIYNTFQMYRHDRLAFLKASHIKAKGKYILGAKLVRGAYLEKESERAQEMRYKNPICASKNATDESFDNGIEYCLNNLSEINLVVASHNEESSLKAAQQMEAQGVANNDRAVYFAQLYGMSDHISFNLASHNYNVCKYIPYGPIKAVLPYLIRRAQENTSIAGQMGRELRLLKDELKRRKSL